MTDSRRIKFRAWWDGRGRPEKQMVEWGLLCSEYIPYGFFPVPENSGWTLMQYTGLKDKNGIEIYEGDILHHVSTRKAGYGRDGMDIYKKVVYGKSNPDNSSLSAYIGFWVVNLNKEDLVCAGSIEYQLESHGAVVIGNIHDNPELLKDK